MKKLVKVTVLTMLVLSYTSFAQTQQQEEENKPKVVKEVENANKSVKQASQTTKETVQTTKETVADLKETVGMIFPKKNKTNKTKDIVLIHIGQIEYGNENLNALYKAITKTKGIKDPSKTFNNSTAEISATYKKSAEDLWQSIPENVRKSFKIKSISESNISITLKEQ